MKKNYFEKDGKFYAVKKTPEFRHKFKPYKPELQSDKSLTLQEMEDHYPILKLSLINAKKLYEKDSSSENLKHLQMVISCQL